MSVDNLIINIGGQGWQMAEFQQRLKSKNETSQVVNLSAEDLSKPPSDLELLLFKKIDANCRIYIVDHGRPNSPNISCHYSELADYLAKRIPAKNLEDQKKHLKISLISCSGGVGEDKSFGGLFHRYLGQKHHINAEVIARNEIVMINPEASRTGKLTDSWLNYGATLFFNQEKAYPLEAAEKYHQTPGSKSKFKWDVNGNEVLVDAYIDKFVELVKGVKDEIFKEAAKLPNSKDIGRLRRVLDEIMVECKKTEEMDLEKIDGIISKLKYIEKLIKPDEDGGQKIHKLISKLVRFRNRSIAEDSVKPVVYPHNISKEDNEVYNPRVMIRSLFNQKVLPKSKLLLRGYPESPEKEKFRNTLKDFGALMINVGKAYLGMGQNIEVELQLIECVKNMLDTANSPQLTKEEKIFQINLLKSKALSLINDEAVSPYLKGAAEGVKVSLGFGGAAGLKALGDFPKAMAELRVSKTASESIVISGLADDLLNFMEKVGYQGHNVSTQKDQITEEATKVLNSKTSQINENINLTQDLLVEILKSGSNKDAASIEKYSQQLNANKQTTNEIKNFQSKMEKFVKDEQRCPNKDIKNIYISRVFPILKYKCEELEKVSQRLEKELNSRNIKDMEELD